MQFKIAENAVGSFGGFVQSLLRTGELNGELCDLQQAPRASFQWYRNSTILHRMY